MHKIFGIKNKFFAEMLFLYLSSNAPKDHKINFKQFFEKLMVFWPEKEKIFYNETSEAKNWRLTQEKMVKDSQYRKFMFAFMRIQGSRTLNILDLIRLSVYFQPDTQFGKEVDKLLQQYNELNIKPRFTFNRIEYSQQNYVKKVPMSCLIEDFRNALIKRFIPDDLNSEDDYMKNREDLEHTLELPTSDWVMSSIPDESKMPQEYFTQLDIRKSKFNLQKIFNLEGLKYQDLPGEFALRPEDD